MAALFYCALTAIQLAPEHALATEKWFLLARHGECFPVRSLERKLPGLGDVGDPDSFIRFVRAKGLNASSKPMPAQRGSAVEVLVPERELALVFVTAEACSKAGGR